MYRRGQGPGELHWYGLADKRSLGFASVSNLQTWRSRLRTEWRDLPGNIATSSRGIWTGLKGRALLFLDRLLDARRLGKNSLPTLSFKSDGYMLAITSFDPMRNWRSEAIPLTATARESFLQYR